MKKYELYYNGARCTNQTKLALYYDFVLLVNANSIKHAYACVYNHVFAKNEKDYGITFVDNSDGPNARYIFKSYPINGPWRIGGEFNK